MSLQVTLKPEKAQTLAERIYKLQPNRTLHLRGFDALGAGAALHSATSDSFKVSGVFRDPADFCVLMLHDADNFYEHPALKYLPDTDFDGLTLTFDVHYSGLRPLDSPRFASIDWPYLDAITTDGSRLSKPLFPNAQQVGGSWTRASGRFTIVDDGMKEFDRLTLWYLNLAFDYIVPKVECNYLFDAQGAGTVHSITVDGTIYPYTEQAGDTGASIAHALTESLAGSPLVTATQGDDTLANGPLNLVNLRVKPSAPQAFEVSSTASDQQFTLAPAGAEAAAVSLASQINATDWAAANVDLPIQARTEGATLIVESTKPGDDGNAITMYAVAKNSRFATAEQTVSFMGGSSDVTWRVTLDFTALGLASVRQMWLTFAPPLASGHAFESTEWEATFTNWTVSGPEEKRQLRVAAPGSVRVEETDSNCAYTGSWTTESGFFSLGYARRADHAGAAVTITYDCAATHDLYIGTSLYIDRGSVDVTLDGGAPAVFSARLNGVDSAIVTRRRVRSAVPAGRHTVTITAKGDGPFYFDFLEAAIPGDVPDALPARTNMSPALDYSTDHTYKLSPARLMWMFDKLGFGGPMNEYIGVFWWNQRVRTGAAMTSATITFNGAYAPGDQIFVKIGDDKEIGKFVFPNESNATFATHFAAFINATSVAVWAEASDNQLTITSHSPTRDYRFTFSARVVNVPGSTGSVDVVSNSNASEGEWMVDVNATPALNRGARDWHADLFRECAAREREIVVASSMELVNPPDDLPARFADGSPVVTDVGFGSLKSTHCSFNSAMRSYQEKVFDCLAGLMDAAGIRPNIQFGEYCWWYFSFRQDPQTGGTVNAGMAFYDPETQAAAEAALGRPLRRFVTPSDDPTGPDALFLRNRLRDHVAGLISYLKDRYPNAVFEVLFPYDVNYPTPVGIHKLGGSLLRFVNFPIEWSNPSTAGFHCLKMEGLDFGASCRDLNLTEETIRFPLDQGWPANSVRYMIPVFNGGCPSSEEYRIAKRYGIAAVNLWAFDHVCIFGLPVTEPGRGAWATRV